MTPAYAVRRDANQSEIVRAFQQLGYTVEECHQVAQFVPGFPDLVVDLLGRVLFIEVKTEGGELTPDEAAFRDRHIEAYRVVYSVDDMLRVVDPWFFDHA